MTDELKNCPFCGSDWIEASYDASEEDHEDGAAELFYYVTCLSCGGSTDWFFTAQDAASKWNTRAEAGRLAARVRELEAALRYVRDAAGAAFQSQDAGNMDVSTLLSEIVDVASYQLRAALGGQDSGSEEASPGEKAEEL